jgi:hypothetical protein
MEAISKNALSAMWAMSTDPGEPSLPTREPFRKVDQIEDLGQFSPNKEGCTKDVYPSGNVA